MAKLSNSVTGLKFISRATSLARSIKRTGKKRQILDGFVVEGGAISGKYRKAAVIDIPQDCYLLQLDYLTSRTNYSGGDTYALPSRDPINPQVPASRFSVALVKEGNYVPIIIYYNAGPEYYVYSIGKVVVQKECASCSMYITTNKNFYDHEDVVNPVLVTGFEPAGTNQHKILNAAVDHNQLESALGSGSAGQRLTLFTSSLSKDSRSFAGPNTEDKHVGRLSAAEPVPISWFYSGKCYTIFPYYDEFGLTIPWVMGEEEDTQVSLISRMGIAQLEHWFDESSDQGRATIRHLSYLDKLPDWLTRQTLKVKRPWREYEDVEDEEGNIIDRILVDGGTLETATYNSIQINMQTARVIEDDDNPLGFPKGALIVAATLKTFVPFEYGEEQWDWSDEDSKWALPVYGTVPLDNDNKFYSDVYGKHFNNECAYPVLVALRIVIVGGSVVGVEVLDGEVLGSKQLLEIMDECGAEVYFNFEQDTFSTEFMLDVLNGGEIVIRKKILERPEKILDMGIDFSSSQEFNLAWPYYKTTIDGVDVTASIGSGVENKKIHYTAPYPLHISRSKERSKFSQSCRVSKETTALPWYEPRQDNDKCYVGIIFTDGDRFITELDGFTDGEIIGVSCPQEEVRNEEDELIGLSAVIVVIYKENVPIHKGEEVELVTGYFMMVRKGPIWPEDESESFKPLNPSKNDYMKWWSDPAPLHDERGGYGVMFCRGSKLVDKLHGEYFKVG